MRIAGLQKLSLLDYPGLVCCTVFTPGCNLRCPFCHNAVLVLNAAPLDMASFIPVEDFFAFLDKRRGLLDAVCVSGGEPLLQIDLEVFLSAIKAKEYTVKLDTNGCYPEQLHRLVSEGLIDYVAMDIKNAPAYYGETVGVPGFDLSPVEESLRFLHSSGLPYELRTTVVREFHDAARLHDLAQWIKGTERYYLQTFKDSGQLIASGLSGYSAEEMQALLKTVQSVIPSAALRG